MIFGKILKTIVAGLVVVVMAAVITACSPSDTTEDQAVPTLIINAKIVDGSGEEAFMGAVRLADGFIVEIGEDLSPSEGEKIIDAGGLVLAPGFIDSHSHHDGGLNDNLDAMPILTQGITTIVVGQDGGHQLPIGGFFNSYEANPAAVNIASYVGHNTIREAIMGDDNKRVATADELFAMQMLLREELSEGALGFSSGLEYEPGLYSKRDEVLTLARDAAAMGGRYISHIRSEDRYLWDALDEIITIGRDTGMPVQISHFKLAAKKDWGQTDRVIKLLDDARDEGIDITADIYPYEYWQSTIFVLLPDRDPNNLAEIKNVLDNFTPADGIIFTHFAPNPDYVNMSVAEIALERGTSEVQTMSDLMNEVLAWRVENPGERAEGIMGRSMDTKDIEAMLQWDHINICSDGGYQGHPRGFGAFPRVFAEFVRGTGSLTLEQAVERMTSRSAYHMGFSDRGLIEGGMKADLVLFDADTIQDHAEIRDGQIPSTGVKHVWVNGVQVLSDGKTGTARPGQVLRN